MTSLLWPPGVISGVIYLLRPPGVISRVTTLLWPPGVDLCCDLFALAYWFSPGTLICLM